MTVNLRYFESVDNLKVAVKARFGRELTSTAASGIAACLQQGRLFFEAAEEGPIEIRPLQLYYGMNALAKALVSAKTVSPPSGLPQRHGLGDVSESGCTLTEIAASVATDGIFHRFNDVAREINGVQYYGRGFALSTIRIPTVKSKDLVDLRFSLRDVLARVGDQKLYELTFGETPKCRAFQVAEYDPGQCEIRVDVSGRAMSIEDFRSALLMVHNSIPFLRRWALIEARSAWDSRILTFTNETVSDEDFPARYWDEENRVLNVRVARPDERVAEQFDWTTALSAIASGRGGSGVATDEFEGHAVSRYSWQFAGMFLLGSLVRYRPDTWIHAISGAERPGRPRDDRALALVEEFLETSTVFSRFVADELSAHITTAPLAG